MQTHCNDCRPQLWRRWFHCEKRVINLQYDSLESVSPLHVAVQVFVFETRGVCFLLRVRSRPLFGLGPFAPAVRCSNSTFSLCSLTQLGVVNL